MADELKNTLLEKLARMLGKSTTAPLLKDALDDAIDLVLNYCNLETLPEALGSTVVRIARDMWRMDGYGQETDPRGVTSVKRGDVTTTWAATAANYSEASGAGGGSLLRNYAKMLNSFRKLR